jgi:hypothetical protein
MPPSQTPDASGTQQGRITIRSVITGALLSLIVSVGFTYTRVVFLTTGMNSDFVTAGAIIVFFGVTVLLNPCIRLVRPGWAFDSAELAVIYIMLIIASTIPTWGFSANLVPMLPAVYYFASPENRWADILHPMLERWMLPQDAEAIKSFFEGLPAGGSVPWGVWLVPMLAWGSFIIAIYLMMIACMVLVRRQWVENERLAFPLMQLPMEMAETGKTGQLLGPFFKNPVMWTGFAVAFCVLSTRGLHQYFPMVPEAELNTAAQLFRDQASVEINLSFTVIGLAYLLSLHVATSFWFFHLLAKAQMSWQFVVGYRLEGDIERFMEGTLMLAHQGMGAMMVLVAFGAWASRSHLKAIARKVFTGTGVDDSEEILSYRAAALILAVCGIYTTIWLNLSGIPVIITVLFLVVAFIIFVFMARLVAEGGIGFMQPQMSAQTIVMNFVGTNTVTDAGIFSMALSFSWAGSVRILLMASAINGMKLAQGVGILKRPLFWVMVVAMLVSLVSSLGIILWTCYEEGAANLEPWFFTHNARNTIAFSAYKLDNPLSFSGTPDIVWPRALWTSIGGTVMGVLIFLRHHFLWWPLHPLGFAVSASNVSSSAWFSIFLGSMIKASLLKYGGVKLYLALRPFFLGMILGQISCAGFWMILDLFAGGTGSRVPVFHHNY